MKNTRFTFSFLTFAIGILTGIFLLVIYSFTTEIPSSTPVPGVSTVPVRDANIMFKRYYSTATSMDERFKGFSINREEFQAMKTLFSQNESLGACRVYMGKDQNNSTVRMVVGVNSNGGDMISSGIYKTPASLSGPCPSVCDVASPITTN